MGKSRENESEEGETSSRRGFLKKGLTAAVGVSSAAMLPSTSSLSINSERPLQYYNGSSQSFSVDPSGNVSASKLGSSSRPLQSLTAESISYSPSRNVTQSVHTNLSQGHVTGLSASGKIISVDPLDFSTDDAAIQEVNNWLASRKTPGGNIYIPAAKPDGSQWVIENQVVVGDPDESSGVQNNLYFTGFALDWDADSPSHMTTTIDNGDQMFRVVGNTGTNTIEVLHGGVASSTWTGTTQVLSGSSLLQTWIYRWNG